MKQSLRILHIEDSVADSELIGNLLAGNHLPCQVTRVDTRTQLFDELQNGSYDIILADCRLPHFSGLHALEIAHAFRPEIPFIFVSGTIGEETAIESLRNGATDYVLKDSLTRLAPAVRRALAEAEERKLCRHMQQRLREAGRLEAISTLSSGIAHDFNNILTIILGHASLLEVERDKPERVAEIARTLTDAAKRGAGVVEQLMAFACKSDAPIIPVDLNLCIREHLPQLQKKAPSRVEIVFEPGADLPNVMADESQLERILRNLIANAVDAMPSGGRITLSTQLVPATDLPDVLTELANGNYVCLKVADTGTGMDATIREHVFEPFYTTKERGRGTGLGLPVVYGLMQNLNGSIHVESEPGKGTVISLFFQVPAPKATQSPPVALGSDPALQGSETILVVEDEGDVSFFVETILQSHGYHVLLARDASEALKIFEEHPDQVDLVFSDVGLPKVDGITLCAKLKKLKPSLPVILGSGYSPKEFKARMSQLGNEAFIAKPYQTHHLLECVRKVLNGSKALTGVS